MGETNTHYSRNKNRSYFYRKGQDPSKGSGHIGMLLLRTRKGYKRIFGRDTPEKAVYTEVKRIDIFQNKNDDYTKVKLMKRRLSAGNLFNAKWVCITSSSKHENGTSYSEEIEIRDGSGWRNSSDKVELLLNYFIDVLERPRASVWGNDVSNKPTGNEARRTECVNVTTQSTPNHVACAWKCY